MSLLFKKLLPIIAGFVAVLLVLFYAIVLLLDNREFLGEAIAYLLVVCIGILMVFFIYLMMSTIMDTLRKRKNDETRLDEKHLEKIFSSASAEKQHTIASATAQRAAYGTEDESRVEEEFLAIRKQAEFEAKKAAEAASEKKRQEKIAEAQRATLEAKAKRIADAEADAQFRAAESPHEEDRRLAAAELEALRRAGQEVQQTLSEEEKARAKALRDEQRRNKAEAEAAALRKTQAIESVRKQAEAAAAARRRAAATAASQPFSAPQFQTGAVASPSGQLPPLSNSAVYGQGQPAFTTEAPQSTAVPKAPTNIWEHMNAPQAAPPAFNPGTQATTTWNSLSGAPGAPAAPLAASSVTQAFTPPRTAVPPVPQTPAPPVRATTVFSPVGAPPASGSAVSNPAQKAAAARALGQTQISPLPVPGSFASGAVNAPPQATGTLPTFRPPNLAGTSPGFANGVGGAFPQPAPQPQGTQPFSAGQPPAFNRGAAQPGQRPSYTAAPVPAAPQPNLSSAPAPGATSRERTSPSSDKADSSGGSSQPEIPRRRGRPPKPRTAEEMSEPKRPRGRPPKILTEEELNAPKRSRGRPPKAASEETAPKRPRGRPPKSGAPKAEPAPPQ